MISTEGETQIRAEARRRELLLRNVIPPLSALVLLQREDEIFERWKAVLSRTEAPDEADAYFPEDDRRRVINERAAGLMELVDSLKSIADGVRGVPIHTRRNYNRTYNAYIIKTLEAHNDWVRSIEGWVESGKVIRWNAIIEDDLGDFLEEAEPLPSD